MQPVWAGFTATCCKIKPVEYLSQVAPNLPSSAKPTLGPDATGVGWVYSYVLQDKTGQHDLAELRSLQDWFLKYELQTVEGVSEVATVGGMVKQYQVQIDPAKLRAYDLTLQQVNKAIQDGNQETGASVVEIAEAEHMVRTTGYLTSIEDIQSLPLKVTEYLSQVAPNLPSSAKPTLGPDATGVGWVYSYVLQDKTGQHDLAELRSLQDWFLKYELQTVEGVSEVATVGGMVKQYQVQIDPAKLRAYDLTLQQVNKAIQDGNQETGASVVEIAEAEHMVRTTGYLTSIEDIQSLPLKVTDKGTPLLLGDIADINLGPQMRRGISELNGEGEAVGGVIVMRFGENASEVIDSVKSKLAELQAGLPDGVEIVATYDRSTLIDSAVENLWKKLAEEFIVVAVVCALFLFHIRSSLVIALSLPVGILGAFIVMHWQGINANIMSLGGIAIAIGAMVDGAIVMIENVHKHIERTPLTDKNRWQVIGKAAEEVGAPLFFSLIIITLSFVPVFALEGQEGKMFSPLAFTKTYAMAAAAGLAITLVPVLMGYFIRGNVLPEHKNPVNRSLVAMYKPLLNLSLKYPKVMIVIALGLMASAYYPTSKLGSEFIPPLDEGDLMYMPTTYPGISIGKARELLQQT
ncbi:hypothetical protein CWN83_22975, partial [Vibrio splendidus]